MIALCQSFNSGWEQREGDSGSEFGSLDGRGSRRGKLDVCTLLIGVSMVVDSYMSLIKVVTRIVIHTTLLSKLRSVRATLSFSLHQREFYEWTACWSKIIEGQFRC